VKKLKNLEFQGALVIFGMLYIGERKQSNEKRNELMQFATV